MKKKKLRSWVKYTLVGLYTFSIGLSAGYFVELATAPTPVAAEQRVIVVKEDRVDYQLPSREDIQAGNYGLFLAEAESSPRLATLYGTFTEEELNTLYAIVRQEGGPEYESAKAVMSTVINRLNSPDWKMYGNTVMTQITAPSQFCYSLDSHWKKYLNGNVEDSVKEAVVDALNGNTNHDFTSFRGGYVAGAVKIGCNWFF